MNDKQRIKALVDAQPDDSSYDEIVRALSFARMVDRGLADARQGRTISHAQMRQRIRSWQK